MNTKAGVLQVKLLVTDVADVHLPTAEAMWVVGQMLSQGFHCVEVNFQADLASKSC